MIRLWRRPISQIKQWTVKAYEEYYHLCVMKINAQKSKIQASNLKTKKMKVMEL